MAILDREILLRWIKPTFISLTVCLILFLITDLFGLTGSLVRHNPPLSILLSYIGYRVGFFVFYLIPLSVLIGGYWGMNGLRQTNEWTALLASGANPLRMLRAPLGALALLTVGMMLYGILVLPRVSDRSRILRNQQIKGKQIEHSQFENLHFILERDRTLEIGRFDADAGRIETVVVTHKTENRIVERVYAREGIYRGEGEWVLREVKVYEFTKSGEIRRETTTDRRVLELEPPAVLEQVVEANPRRLESQPAEFRLGELVTAIRFRDERDMDTAPERVYYHWKFGFPLSTMVLGFIGVTTGLRAFEKRAAGIGFCVLLGFLYWIVFSVSISLGKTSHLGWGVAFLEPLFFVYGPPLGFLAGTVYFWLRVR